MHASKDGGCSDIELDIGDRPRARALRPPPVRSRARATLAGDGNVYAVPELGCETD